MPRLLLSTQPDAMYFLLYYLWSSLAVHVPQMCSRSASAWKDCIDCYFKMFCQTVSPASKLRQIQINRISCDSGSRADDI